MFRGIAMKMLSLALSFLVFSPISGERLLAQSTPAPQTSAQQPDTGQSGILFHQETNNVLIDVIATDKHGKPVASLDKSQFTLTENGKPQSIAFFEEHDPSHDASPITPPPPQLPAGEYTNVEVIPSRGPLIVLLVDALDSSPTDMSMLRQQLKKYLEQVPAGSHVALFALTDKLRLIQGFTEDPKVLKAAVEKGGKADLSNHIDNLSDAFADQVFAAEVSLNQFFAASEANYVHQDHRAIILDALLNLSSYLKELPGRKDLLWFAGNWSWVPLPKPHQSSELDEMQLDNQQISDLFVESRVALYPVDVRGLFISTGPSQSTPTSSRATAAYSGGSIGTDGGSESNLGERHLWMNQIATATGGRAIYDTNGISQAVSRAESESQHYYTLAYAPGNGSDISGFRHIEIKVATPGIKLEYRTGYYASNTSDSYREKEKVKNPLTPIMQFGAPNATQIPFHIDLAIVPQQPDLTEPAKRIGVEAAKLKSPPIRYRFTWHVDLQHILLTTGPDGLKHGKFTACLAAYDSEGKLLNHITGNLAFKISPADVAKYRDSGMPITQSFDLPAGHIFIRAGLLDPDTDHTGATEFAVAVDAAKPGIAQLK